MVAHTSPASLVSRERIAALLPHGESMCLLDGVQRWDKDSIVALSLSHHQDSNPLREQGSLAAVALVEYAAQAAAVHAGLTDTGLVGDQVGFIGAIKALKLHAQKVPAEAKTLFCEAQCSFNNGSGAIYQFTVRSDLGLIIEGRVVLVTPGSHVSDKAS
jgi:predicted hotdog family 3-hydroxylacyl-ACP dehydratase